MPRPTPPAGDRGRGRASKPAHRNERSKPPGQAKWGSVARRGARVVQEGNLPPQEQTRSDQLTTIGRRKGARANTGHDQEEWRDDGPVRATGRPSSRGATNRAAPFRPPLADLPIEVGQELALTAGAARGAKLADRLKIAANAYSRDRYAEAFRITKQLVAEAPGSASARELHGLVCYRLARYRDAIGHLEHAAVLAGGDPSQLPVIMDCHRAMGHHRRVAELWEQLRSASPEPDVLTEGRMVLAADLADRGELASAVELLAAAGAGKNLRNPAERHVRQWYVMADLYERAGNLPRARELFARVAEADPDLGDAAARVDGLGRARRRGSRPKASPRSKPGTAG